MSILLATKRTGRHLIDDQDVRLGLAVCSCGAKFEAPERHKRMSLIYAHLSEVYAQYEEDPND